MEIREDDVWGSEVLVLIRGHLADMRVWRSHGGYACADMLVRWDRCATWLGEHTPTAAGAYAGS